jgi:flavin-dependent dehydrogenase
MGQHLRYDVAIVGGSIGGCTAALFFARRGLRVALIERNEDPHAYKKVCTHFIQPSAVPTLERLGLTGMIEAAGALRNRLEVHTRWGWIRDSEDAQRYGYNIRRETLDPLLRTLAATTVGVDFMPGASPERLLEHHGRIVGVEIARQGRPTVAVDARLVVAADGRHSQMVKLAGVPVKSKVNGRFTYFTYYRDLPLSSAVNSQYWYMEPELAYAFTNDDRLTLLGAFLPNDQLAEWKRDVQGHFVRFWDRVPGAPSLRAAEQVGEMRGMVHMPNVSRPAAWKGMALVGDAALSLDPIWGTGCGFAFQSAEWLADCAGDALGDGAPSDRAIDRGLEQYRKRHRAATLGHALHIADFSKARDNRFLETLLMSAATRDGEIAHSLLEYLARDIGITHLARKVLRAIWVHVPYAGHVARA